MSKQSSPELFIPAPVFRDKPDPGLDVHTAALMVRNGQIPWRGGFVEIPGGLLGAFDYVEAMDMPGGNVVIMPLPKNHVTGTGNYKEVSEPGGKLVFWDLESGRMRFIASYKEDTGFPPRRHIGSIALYNGIRQSFYDQPTNNVFDITNVSECGKVTVARPARFY